MILSGRVLETQIDHTVETQSQENVIEISNVQSSLEGCGRETLNYKNPYIPINLFIHSTNICDRKYGKTFRQMVKRLFLY